jgi:hypothetical protein
MTLNETNRSTGDFLSRGRKLRGDAETLPAQKCDG